MEDLHACSHSTVFEEVRAIITCIVCVVSEACALLLLPPC